MRSMIKPRSQPSLFELKADQEQWNSEGKFSVHSSDSCNQTNVELLLPATAMESVTTPAVTGGGSKVRFSSDPVCSPGASRASTSFSERGSSPGVPPKTPLRCSTRANKGIPPVHFTPPKKSLEYSGKFFRLCRTCSGSVRTLSFFLMPKCTDL